MMKRWVMICLAWLGLAVAGVPGQEAGEDLNFHPESERDNFRNDGDVAEIFRALNEGDPERAQLLVDEALAQHPTSGLYLFTETYVMLDRGDEHSAIARLEELHKDYPGNYRVLNNLAWLLTTARDPGDRAPERALKYIQDALLQGANNYHVWSTLAQVHYELGNYERAERAAREAYRLAVEGKAPSEIQARYIQQVDQAQIARDVFELMD
ncbi:MAG: tetratricopeptide repeat protein [Kiritimatiellae bacterium]|nr:tetratricopeptide repeat protein [Kiritimatiellia bacterium]